MTEPIKPENGKPTEKAPEERRTSASTASDELPKLARQSVILECDPSGQLGAGVTLRDLDNETELPELQLDSERYQVLELLGEGGMSKVYLAYDRDLKRKLALKLVTSEQTKLTERFLEEAQVIAQLQHPNIAPIHDIGVTKNGDVYYTMRLLRGLRLSDVLNGLRRDAAGNCCVAA